jgi:hypothetical protein
MVTGGRGGAGVVLERGGRIYGDVFMLRRAHD